MSRVGFAILGGVAVSVLYFILGLLNLGASTPSGKSATKPCEWPDSLDAVAAAPNNHKILIENDRVRVLDVTVAPGEMENLHAHCRSSVMYLMYEGVYKDFGPNGELVAEAIEAAPAEQFPMTLWLDPQGPHRVHNLDPKPVRLLRVELKD